MFTGNSPFMTNEDWQITDVKGGEGADGWIAVTVNNTGIVPVTLVKTSVNFAKQSTSPSLPLTLQPDTGTVLNMTINVYGGTNYDIRVYNSNGNHSEVEWEAPWGFMGSGESLQVGTPYGWNSTSVTVNVANTGGGIVTIKYFRVTGTQVALNGTTGYVLNPKDTPSVVCTSTTDLFTLGYTYTITLITSNNKEFPTTGTYNP
jgi:hypothetical protein